MITEPSIFLVYYNYRNTYNIYLTLSKVNRKGTRCSLTGQFSSSKPNRGVEGDGL